MVIFVHPPSLGSLDPGKFKMREKELKKVRCYYVKFNYALRAVEEWTWETCVRIEAVE